MRLNLDISMYNIAVVEKAAGLQQPPQKQPHLRYAQTEQDASRNNVKNRRPILVLKTKKSGCRPSSVGSKSTPEQQARFLLHIVGSLLRNVATITTTFITATTEATKPAQGNLLVLGGTQPFLSQQGPPIKEWDVFPDSYVCFTVRTT